MKKHRSVGRNKALLAALGAAALCLSPAATHAETKLAIAATGQTSSFYAYHTAVAQVLGKVAPDLNVSVMETGGSVENLKLLNRGQADWGQFAEPVFYEKYAGIGGAVKKGPNPKLRFLAPVTQVAFYNVVNADAGVGALVDLSGKSYGPGSSGSNTERLTLDLFGEIGVKPTYVRGSYGDLVAAMKDRRIVGYTKAGSLTTQDSTIMDVRSSVPVKILGYSKEQVEAIRKAYPHYLFVSLEKTPYGNDPAVLNNVVLINGTTSDLPEEIGYRVFAALVEQNEEIAKVYKPAAGADIVKLTLESAKTPLHAGVVRYLREKGHSVPASLVPPEAK